MKRRWIILIFAAVGVWFGATSYTELQSARGQLAGSQLADENLDRQKAELAEQVAALRETNRAGSINLAAHTGELRLLLERKPVQHAVWNEPPAQWPAWEPDSPFIWVPKTQIDHLAFDIFDGSGRILPQFTNLFALTRRQTEALNRELRDIVEQYSALELRHAHPTNSHLPGIDPSQGPALTIEVPEFAQEAEPLKVQFDQALRKNLGQQRAEMMMNVGRSWIGERLNNFGAQPRKISIQRRTTDSYYIAMQSSAGWLSMGRPNLEGLVPPHLITFFEPLLAQHDERSSK
ncbi:MAG TPA: hypothetical protein VEH27_16415 [Methylomirabilota bacterium]|nr:hypothetical protein [Methylomirabilota bacterium]